MKACKPSETISAKHFTNATTFANANGSALAIASIVPNVREATKKIIAGHTMSIVLNIELSRKLIWPNDFD